MSDKRHYDGFEVLRMNLFQLQVCSDLPSDQVEQAVRSQYAAGTQHSWQLYKDGDKAPVKCDDKEGFWHYMFYCKVLLMRLMIGYAMPLNNSSYPRTSEQ